MGAALSGEGRRVSGKWETGSPQISRTAGALAFVLQGKARVVSWAEGAFWLIQLMARDDSPSYWVGKQEKGAEGLGLRLSRKTPPVS